MIRYWYIISGFSNWIFYFINPLYKKKMERLFSYRLSKCEQCEYLKKKTRQCSFCCCFVDAKTKCIYKLDKDKKSYYLEDDKSVYACQLKKW